ncbi:MAG TPA: MFS transporter [Tepidisphaeraceae bacterium]|jgi:sugar phosphate permease|nr:MFS transporter [Tepidisphaeraceae bacterium]
MSQLDYQTQRPVSAAPARFARVMPLAFITYSLAYLDRVNIGFGGAGGMRETLKLNENQFTWFNATFFIGYVLFQIPGAGYAARRSVKTLMFWTLIFWGIVASATAVLTDYRLLLIDRFLLGVAEGLVFPSLLVFLTHWFTKRERSRANTLLILGNPLTMLWASLLSGTLVALFDRHPIFHMKGWQMMLLVEGIPTLIWACLWWMLANDRPIDAGWLSADESANVQAALDDEQRQVKHVKNYLAAFGDPQVILLCLLFFAWSVGIYGLNMWLPIIMKTGSHMGIASVGLFNAIPYLCGAVVMLVISAISDRLLIRKAFVWPCLFVGAVAFLGSYLAGPNHFWLSFTGLIVAGACMYAPYGPFWAMIPEMVSRNVIGESLALINTIGAVGGFVGTFGVGRLHKITGGYGVTFACLSICLALAGVLTLAIRIKRGTDSGFEVTGR